MNDKIKYFLVKLISITFAIIIIINVFYNLFLAERFENIDKMLSLTKKENRIYVKDKIRNEIKRSLKKDKILNNNDKILLYEFYKKIKKEFGDIDTTK